MGTGPPSPPARVRIVVELGRDREGRPVGSVSRPSEAPVPFIGWLALMAELTRSLEGVGGTTG